MHSGGSVRTLLPVALRVTVIGAGSWGTTVAALAAAGHETVLWSRRKDVADEIVTEHTNAAYLPGVVLPEGVRATPSMEEAVAAADVVVMAVPSHGFRDVLVEAAPFVRPWVPIVSLTKGLEIGTRLRMTKYVRS